MEQISTAQKITQSLRASVGALRGNVTVCSQCNSMFTSTHNRGQLYCSRRCSKTAFWQNASQGELDAQTAKMSASLTGRPSWNKGIPCRETTKAKLSAAHKLSGHKPKILGGNGRTCLHEAMAAEMLPTTWLPQYAIATKQPRGSGYPPCYKADFANPGLMKILEIDGNSHTSRRRLDAKKDLFLASLGWSVYRATNKEVQSMYTTFKSTGRTTILSKVR
jgi:very-short-patch-repair endonuclease